MRLNLKHLALSLASSLILSSIVFSADIPETSLDAPNNLKVIVKEIGPVTQPTDLQIVCTFKHSDNDKYIEAAKDFNEKQGKIISNLREAGEFAGELGETFLYTPPSGSIAAKRVLMIGVGDFNSISLDRLKLAGRIAAREAVRIQAKNVSFAPTLRDQTSDVIDVGEGDAAFVEQVVLAYDTEKKLQAQGLNPEFSIDQLTIEAGAKYFSEVVDKVTTAIQKAADEIKARSSSPYVSTQSAQ